MKNSVLAIALTCVVFVGVPTVSSAFLSSSADVDYSLGLGIGFVPDYEGSEDYERSRCPTFRRNGKTTAGM